MQLLAHVVQKRCGNAERNGIRCGRNHLVDRIMRLLDSLNDQTVLVVRLLEQLRLLRSAFQSAGANQPGRQQRKYDQRHDRSKHASGEKSGGQPDDREPIARLFSTVPLGRAWIGVPLRNRWMSSASSLAVG